VSVIGRSAAVADAAATFIGNMTTAEGRGVVRRKARDIDPLTDIPDEMVTIERGELDKKTVAAALAHGREHARRLKSAGVIMDALIILGEEMVDTIDENSNLTLEEVPHGN
jgi:hypothetical protein